MNRNPYQGFSHYELPLSDFDRARQQIATPFDSYDVDLSIARKNKLINIAGDFIYIDMASTGYATIELNNQQDAPKAPFLVRKGFALGATFKQLKISNNAQAGGLLRIMYSTGDRVIPALGDVNISGSVSTVLDGMTYGASYKTIAGFATNTPDTVFSPGANVNGAIIHAASFASEHGSGTGCSAFIAKNGTPASIVDGDVILGPDAYNLISAGRSSQGSLKNPVKIAAGKGLFFITNSTESQPLLKSVLYTLL